MKRWGCGQITVGCAGLFLGASVTIGVEVYLASRAVRKVSDTYNEWETQAKFETLCASEAWKNDADLKKTCDELWEQKKRTTEAASKAGATE